MSVIKIKMVPVIDQERTAGRAYRMVRASEHSLRDIAKRMGITAGHLSRLTRGEKIWNYDQACAFDAAILRGGRCGQCRSCKGRLAEAKRKKGA
jgi:hypothetical protein